MKLLVLTNLQSGLGDKAVFDYIRAFMKNDDEVVIRSSDGNTDLRCYLYDADTYDVVVVAAGDGTVSSIAHELANTGIPVLAFPGGTANLLSINLLLPHEIHALTKMTRELSTMDFDLGEMILPDGKKFGFTIMAGSGYDATIMKGAEAGKKLLGPAAYFTSAFTNTKPQFSKITMDIDGKHIETEGVGVVIVNFSRIQFDISVVHENKPRDGVFDIVVFNTKDAFGLLPAFFAAILDKSGDFPSRTDAFQLFQGKNVVVNADPPLEIQFDGELRGLTTPFEARILPEAGRFVVNENCIREYGE